MEKIDKSASIKEKGFQTTLALNLVEKGKKVLLNEPRICLGTELNQRR